MIGTRADVAVATIGASGEACLSLVLVEHYRHCALWQFALFVDYRADIGSIGLIRRNRQAENRSPVDLAKFDVCDRRGIVVDREQWLYQEPFVNRLVYGDPNVRVVEHDFNGIAIHLVRRMS